VDSSALAEQVVADVLVSAFDSAGQRCSALRVLCLQEDVADHILGMLRGALAELALGNPDRLATDIGPVIDADARDGIEAHLAAMRAAGHAVHQAPLPASCAHGTFVAPAIVELPDLSALREEVFGPVLHVVRFRAAALDALLAGIAATGYALTFGLHTRLDETVARVTAQASAGNIYVNRNVVGAVVGVQPFGGHGLSGTGPKAGGPLYLRRLLARAPALDLPGRLPAPARLWQDARQPGPATTPLGFEQELAGPVGERNLYTLEPRGAVLCVAADQDALRRQVGAVLATGNRALIGAAWLDRPEGLAGWIVGGDGEGPAADAVLFSGTPEALLGLARTLAARPGPILGIHVPQPDGGYPLEWLVRERSVSTNTTAAGGNANLMMIG